MTNCTGTVARERIERHVANHPSVSPLGPTLKEAYEELIVRRLQKYHDFLKSCSVEQKEACECILKFGSGILAVGIAAAGKSVALNQVGMILECMEPLMTLVQRKLRSNTSLRLNRGNSTRASGATSNLFEKWRQNFNFARCLPKRQKYRTWFHISPLTNLSTPLLTPSRCLPRGRPA